MEEPYIALANLACYAVPGCLFLFWGILFRSVDRRPGQRNVTSDVPGFRRHIEALGFGIVRELPRRVVDGAIS